MDKLSTLLSHFDDDINAHWISSPVQRLILEALYRLSYVVMEHQNKSQECRKTKKLCRDDPQLKFTLDILRNIPGETLNSKLIHEAVSIFTLLLVDHKKALMGAAAQTLLGAVKSSVFGINQDLIKGLYKGFMAGFDM